MNIRAQEPSQDLELELQRVTPMPEPAAPPADPLSDSLLYLAGHHGRAISRGALLAGLPIERGALTPDLYERAAQRAGLEAKLEERPLEDIPALVLPAVVLLHDGSTRILLGIDRDAGRLTLIAPSQSQARSVERIETIAEQYTGFVYFVRPANVQDPRAAAAEDLPKAHWFW